jgi:hypothetical protein
MGSALLFSLFSSPDVVRCTFVVGLVKINSYSEQPTPDYMNITRCWIFLGETDPLAKLLRDLLDSGKEALAYQVSFDLYSSATQQFLKIVSSQLAPGGEEGEGAGASSVDASVVQRVQDILAGIYTLEVYKEFLSRNNHSDELILSNTKVSLPSAVAVNRYDVVFFLFFFCLVSDQCPNCLISYYPCLLQSCHLFAGGALEQHGIPWGACHVERFDVRGDNEAPVPHQERAVAPAGPELG